MIVPQFNTRLKVVDKLFFNSSYNKPVILSSVHEFVFMVAIASPKFGVNVSVTNVACLLVM